MSVPATLKTTATAAPTGGNASTTSPPFATGAAVQNLAGNAVVAAAGLVGALLVAL